jgi:hypothetical protein
LKKHVVKGDKKETYMLGDYFTDYKTKSELKKLPGVNRNLKRDYVEDEEDVIRE